MPGDRNSDEPSRLGAVAAEETVETLRPLMFSIAYRMVGSVADAEDVVQEAFLRHQRALDDGAAIRSPKAYLSAVVTRLLDRPPPLGAHPARNLCRAVAAGAARDRQRQ